ncbi:ATP phosphoribosyltransferase regulatory subunit (plasmid) [Acetobacter orientalis]|uniref:ATP phosphoribosyltransferase regulatory subunit n=1 Tax=Acetobacter orientalis TaxID=146474 RepID=A0A2Z5ZM59_9PROT|nr:ATP phosphoribosyltransferase regulatory subunit [Acetobacter orientalis]
MHGVGRPKNASLETCKVWLADTLAKALEQQASVVIDMGAATGLAKNSRRNPILDTFSPRHT